ncbi:MAG TPA: HlyD family secretion protein [Alphaproteobacteria bacterium]|nr:HlyD family secretion protein [Alphaproteobacteria bacterium]
MLKKKTPENLSMAERITSLRKNADAARPAPVDGARAPAASRRQLVRWGLIGLGPLVVLIAALWFYVTGGRYVSTDDAFVKTDLISINAQVPGQVTGLYVHNNQSVDAGQLLFELDPRSYQIALDQAEANLINVKSQIDSLRANYLEKAALLKNAEETVQFQQREYNRQANLRSSGVASEQKVDEARRAYDNAQQQTDVFRQQMAAIQAQLGGDVNKPTEELATYRAALARRDDAALALSRTKVVAPAAGVVANVTLRPGDYISTGTPVFSLAEIGHTWIEANFKETELTHVVPGQEATVTVDTYPGITWKARVESLSPASGNEFSLLPAQNSSGNWVKVVQRIPVRLALEPQPGAPQLRAGMSVMAEIDTGPHHPAWLQHVLNLI